jgi:hypothetical protein
MKSRVPHLRSNIELQENGVLRSGWKPCIERPSNAAFADYVTFYDGDSKTVRDVIHSGNLNAASADLAKAGRRIFLVRCYRLQEQMCIVVWWQQELKKSDWAQGSSAQSPDDTLHDEA